jgi:hypothetical protein
MPMTNLIILVFLVHPAVTLFYRDDLARVLHDDLVGLKAAVAADAVASVSCLKDLNAHAVSTALLGPCLQRLEGAVVAELLPNVAVGLVTLVEHDAVLAIFTAPILRLAHALGGEVLKMWRLLPVGSSVAYKAV